MSLSALDKRATAAINGLELPSALETLVMSFGCIHGYAVSTQAKQSRHP